MWLRAGAVYSAAGDVASHPSGVSQTEPLLEHVEGLLWRRDGEEVRLHAHDGRLRSARIHAARIAP